MSERVPGYEPRAGVTYIYICVCVYIYIYIDR